MLRSTTGRVCAALCIFLLAGCGGGTPSVSSMDRSAEIPQQPGSSSGGSSPGSVTHPSCDGYPRTGIPVLNGTTVCEERDYFGLPAGNGVNVDTGIGDIVVLGGARSGVDLKAFVYAHGLTEEQARDTLAQVVVHTDDGHYYATGPDDGPGPITISLGGTSWWVSFDAAVPSQLDLQANNSNGSIVARDLSGHIGLDNGVGDIEATNLSGSVIVGNGNGATTIDLGGAAWNGSGVQVVSGTGDTTFLVPSNYNAVFELQTATGSIHSDFGSAPQSEDYTGEQMTQVVGNGGATLSVQSGNGDITLRRKN